MSSLLSAAVAPAHSFVHPPTTFAQLLHHPLGCPLILSKLEQTPHGLAVHFWMELEQLRTGMSCRHGGTPLTSAQAKRVQASVVARIRAALIRKHREMSKAVQQPVQPRAHAQSAAAADASSDDETSPGGCDNSTAKPASSDEFVSHSSSAPVQPAAKPSADTDLLLDVIQLQLVDSKLSASEQPSTVALTLGEAGEEYALHSYADQLTRHLLTRIPQMQSHLESVLAEVYGKAIMQSTEYETLVKSETPTQQAIAAAAAALHHTQPLTAAERAIPAFDPANTKLVVTYRSKGGAKESNGASNAASSSRGQMVSHTLYFRDLPTGMLVIGRSDHADITLPDSGVSRTHARLSWTPLVPGDSTSSSLSAPSTLRYTDFDTTYGSKLDGAPVKSALLQVGSVITLGKHCTLKVLRCDQQDGETRTPGASASPQEKDSKCAVQ